jgi:hypothetical protein
MNMRAILDGLGPLLASVSGCRVADADTDAFRFPPRGGGADSFARLDFHVRDVTPVGLDELRSEYDPDAEVEDDTYEPELGGITYTQTGQRSLVLEVRVECDTPFTAWPFAERVRDRIDLPSTEAALEALGLAVARCGRARDMTYASEGRMLSVAVLEIWLNAASGETEGPVTTIEDFTAEIEEAP